MILKILLPVFFLVSFNSYAFNDYEARYGLYFLGLKIAEENRHLEVKGEIIKYYSKARTKNIGKLFEDSQIEAESTLTINNNIIEPKSYTSKVYKQGKIQEVLYTEFLEKDNILIISQQKNNGKIRVYEKNYKDYLDPLSSFLVIPNKIQSNYDIGLRTFLYSDGKRMKEFKLKALNTVEELFNKKQISLFPVEMQESKDEKITIFFAKELNYLPFKIVKEDNGKSFEYRLEKINFLQDKTSNTYQ